MGDVGDYWREHREYRRSKGLPTNPPKPPARHVDFSRKWQKLGFKYFTAWHWQIALKDGLLDFWPSKTKWRYRGETVQGTVSQLLKIIKTEQASVAQATAPVPQDAGVDNDAGPSALSATRRAPPATTNEAIKDDTK